MDHDALSDEDETPGRLAALDDLTLALGHLVRENQSEALAQPSYLRVPPDPPLHRLTGPDATTAANQLSGTVHGPAVQAGVISGGIHLYRPPEAPPHVPWQMPRVPARFINRSADLAAMDKLLLAEPRSGVVLLTGPAGVGKSALARSWLWLRRDHFPDGVLYADLRDRDDEMSVYRVLCAFVTALGAGPDRLPAEIENCAALFRSLTSTRRVAVLIDSGASSTRVRPLLPAGEHAVGLITSTHRLALLLLDDVHILALEPLRETEATLLLERYAGATRIAAQPDAAHRIVQRCAGLPLALCAVGAQLTMHPSRDLESITQQLSDQGGLLEGLTVEGNPVVYHAIDAGYRALSAEAARLYRLLSKLPIDAFTAPVAAAAAHLIGQDAARQLDALADAHLLYESAAGAYRFYPLTALHARESAEASENMNTAIDRVITWYLTSAINAAGTIRPYRRAIPVAAPLPQLRPVSFTDLGAALDWLDAESGCLLALAHYCAQHQRTRTALEITAQMWALWAYRKYYPLWEEFDALGLACARTLGDRDAEARMLRRLGLLCTQLGRYPEAREHLQDAAEIFEQRGDEHRTATALNSLGVVELRDGDPEAAIMLLTRALTIHRVRGEARQTALVLLDLADAEIEHGQPEVALAHLHDANSHFEDSPDIYSVARLRMLRGRAQTRNAVFDEAERELAAALELMQGVGSAFGQAQALYYLSELAVSTEKSQLAARHRAEAGALLEQLCAPSSGWLSVRIAASSAETPDK